MKPRANEEGRGGEAAPRSGAKRRPDFWRATLAFYVLSQLAVTACEPTRIEKGLCELDCQRDEKYCNLGTDQRQCVAKDDPRFGCGSDDCSPCLSPGAKMICDLNGACVVGGCEKEFADCEPELPGCETRYLEDVKHCGRCNNPCAAQQSCSNGFCVGGDAGTAF